VLVGREKIAGKWDGPAKPEVLPARCARRGG
jgi:hypothetical protein